MEKLNLSKDGLTIQSFEVRKESAMMYVETTGKLTFHLSVDGGSFSEWPQTVDVNSFIHIPLHHMKIGSLMKVTCNSPMSNPKIIW